MFADIATKSTELGVLFDETLHIADGVDGRGALCERTRLVGLDVGFEGGAEVAKGCEVVCEEERVGGRCQRYFLS